MVEFKDLGITTATLFSSKNEFQLSCQMPNVKKAVIKQLFFLQLDSPSQKFSVALTKAAVDNLKVKGF